MITVFAVQPDGSVSVGKAQYKSLKAAHKALVRLGVTGTVGVHVSPECPALGAIADWLKHCPCVDGIKLVRHH